MLGERHWYWRYQDFTEDWYITRFRDVMDILRHAESVGQADFVIVLSDDEVLMIGAQSGRVLHYKADVVVFAPIEDCLRPIDA